MEKEVGDKRGYWLEMLGHSCPCDRKWAGANTVWLEGITAAGKCWGRLNIRISNGEAEEMAQLVSCPLCNNEDLGVVVWVCNPRTGKAERGRRF